MRVITGTARGRKLVTVEGTEVVRPTTDGVKEAIFSAIQFEIEGRTVLDLFAGSGQLGIEALSRGAAMAVFVENSRKAVECINKNLAFTKLADRAQVLSADAVHAVGMLERQGQAFDVIFMDPPYGKLLEKAVLERLAGSPLMDDDTMVIVESDLDTNFDYLDDLGLELYKTKKYKTNKHTFIYRRLEDE